MKVVSPQTRALSIVVYVELTSSRVRFTCFTVCQETDSLELQNSQTLARWLKPGFCQAGYHTRDSWLSLWRRETSEALAAIISRSHVEVHLSCATEISIHCHSASESGVLVTALVCAHQMSSGRLR